MEVMSVRPALPDSYESSMPSHRSAGVPAGAAPARAAGGPRGAGSPARLERAIGVIYRPETERQSHYFYASLPDQFDEYIWLDGTTAVTPLERARRRQACPIPIPSGSEFRG